MNKHPLWTIQQNDNELFTALNVASGLALKDGALPAKYKLLTAMALDASRGAAGGVKSLAQQALEAGATKEEIFDTLRVVYHICGSGSIYTASQGLADVFNQTVL